MRNALMMIFTFFGCTALAQEKTLDKLVTTKQETAEVKLAGDVTVSAKKSTEMEGAKTLITKAERQTIGRLKNVYKIDEGIFRSEQPGRNDFSALEEMGLTEVLSVRRFWNDDRKTKHTGLKTHHISMKAGDIVEHKVVKALKVIRDRKGPLLIHCWHGADRTGMLVAMYRMVFQNWPKEAAIDEMTKGDFGFHSVYGNIIDFINEADIPKIKEKVLGKNASEAVFAAEFE
ncbi:tyrosine-protein phosphatase [Desertivirga brevis]|uniref:tyrosine-protein phosphatase n=1 Tax=Desertivirga brevis TaxID=2810310 RepID=UPI001A96FC92|nr:tyrosine-protein phosphatase [Pedobacter sp. SYSU D00873]